MVGSSLSFRSRFVRLSRSNLVYKVSMSDPMIAQPTKQSIILIIEGNKKARNRIVHCFYSHQQENSVLCSNYVTVYKTINVIMSFQSCLPMPLPFCHIHSPSLALDCSSHSACLERESALAILCPLGCRTWNQNACNAKLGCKLLQCSMICLDGEFCAQ